MFQIFKQEKKIQYEKQDGNLCQAFNIQLCSAKCYTVLSWQNTSFFFFFQNQAQT